MFLSGLSEKKSCCDDFPHGKKVAMFTIVTMSTYEDQLVDFPNDVNLGCTLIN